MDTRSNLPGNASFNTTPNQAAAQIATSRPFLGASCSAWDERRVGGGGRKGEPAIQKDPQNQPPRQTAGQRFPRPEDRKHQKNPAAKNQRGAPLTPPTPRPPEDQNPNPPRTQADTRRVQNAIGYQL